jgi:hypothetical protein
MTQRLVIDALWFTTKDGSIGAVAIETQGGWKAYIGQVDGFNEHYDRQYVANWGAKLPRSIAVAMFPNLEANKYVY